LICHQERADVRQTAQLAESLNAKIAASLEEIDTELLWDSVARENKELEAAELAEIYFGSRECCLESAVLRAVMADPVHFRVRASGVQPRPPEQVEEQERALRRQAEKEAHRQQARAWFAEILSGSQAEPGFDPLEVENIIRRLEDFLLQRQKDDEVALWLEGLEPEVTPRMAAYEVLSSLGRLPASADPLLAAAGIDPRFSREALESAAALVPYLAESRDPRFGGELTFAIDDEETREVDDAITVREIPGGLEIAIHIADVASFVEPGSPLDLEARRRVATVYLPQTTVRMLPEPLSCDLASLVAGAVRPVVTLLVRFEENFRLTDWRFSRAEAVVARNISYDRIDQILDQKDDPAYSAVSRLHALAGHLLRERTAAGALTINRPEVKVIVRKDSVRLKVLDSDSPSRSMVRELMVLMNRLAATYAIQNSVPVIFRTQPPPTEPITLPDFYDPVRVNEAFSRLEKSRLSVEPGRHAGLALDQYTQFSSPIRRYADLVVQRQIVAALSGVPLPYQAEDLMEIISQVQQMDRDIRSAERSSNRFYTLTYLNDHCRDQVIPGVVIRVLDRGYLVETLDYLVRGLLPRTRELAPGNHLELKIDQIFPARNVLVFRESEPQKAPNSVT
jgi:exoribonuclease-2